ARYSSDLTSAVDLDAETRTEKDAAVDDRAGDSRVVDIDRGLRRDRPRIADRARKGGDARDRDACGVARDRARVGDAADERLDTLYDNAGKARNRAAVADPAGEGRMNEVDQNAVVDRRNGAAVADPAAGAAAAKNVDVGRRD